MKEEKPTTNNIFYIKDNNGENVECEVLFTFSSNETNKNYVIYTDHKTDDAGSINVYANTYDPSGTSKELGAITTEEEWNTIESILSKLNEKEGK